MFVKKLTRQVICNPDEPVVSTPAGKLRGVIVDDTFIFRGIRYATARRFHAPEPIPAWEGVREAIIYGPVCPEIHTPVPHDEYTVPHVFYPQDEDCLFLNVWTQHLDQRAKRPVLVWMHGGGYFSGSGIEHYAYDGEEMSRFGDAVVVTLNHRLNVLGYCDLSAYGPAYQNSGNAGQADLVAALQWVRDNIASFGGDPDNVTIFGQSGGGGKVVTLLQMPAADGLFHRAIIQSGGMNYMPGMERTQQAARKLSEYLLSELGLTADQVAEAERAPYWQLAEAAQRATDRMGRETGQRISWGPTIDGDYYVGHPMSVGFRKGSAHIPLLAGSVFGEFRNNFNQRLAEGGKNQWPEALRAQLLQEQLGPVAPAAEAAFRQAFPEKNPVDVLFLDDSMRRAAVDFTQKRAADGGVAYNYFFTLESPFNGGTTAWHNAEIPYAFHNAEYLEPSFIPGVTETLQDQVCGAWVAFARSGDPNHDGLPDWPAVTPGKQPTMIFDRATRLGVDFDAALLDVLGQLPPKPMRLPKGGGPAFLGGPKT